MRSIGLNRFCMVSGCPPDDWDCEGLLTCDAKEAESVNDGLMISGSDFMTREIHSMDEIMLKSQTTNKFCSPSDPSTMSIVSCAERHYDDEALFVIEKVDDDTAGEGSLGYPGWSPEPSGGGGGAPPGGGDAVKTVIRIRPADSPQSWCHVFSMKEKGGKTHGIRCGGSFVKGMDLFEVVDIGGGGAWGPPSAVTSSEGPAVSVTDE